jgi:threonine dehydrogenase-like Zn-dependent dehydrogenase/glycosyltransferase involved in cell wall biosynthesis
MPSVSVIIRAHDEERHLPRLLEQIRRQNGEPAEIVVVDSGSRDRTVTIAEEGADKVVHIEPERFTFGSSLNHGCRAAGGDVLAIVSAHTYPSSNNWLPNLMAPFEDPGVAMVYGRQLPFEGTRVGEARDFATTYGPHSRVLIDEPFGNNANAAVRRELWERHHFDESLTGLEDIEWARWAQREGHSVWYAANAAIVHIHEESLAEVYQRHWREGAAHAELFPHARGEWDTVLLEGLVELIRDVRFGRTTGRRARELLAAPAFRAAATVGFFRGGIKRERQRATAARGSVAASSPPHRAVVVSGPGLHELVESEANPPEPDEVTIRVAYVGVCATDVEVAEGRQAYYRDERARFPIVPGHEYSGVVEQAGSPEHESLVGARVVGECALGCGACAHCARGMPSRCPDRRETGVLNKDGAYATRVTVPAAAVHRLPDGLPLLHASLVEPTAVVLKALRKARRVRGARAAVVGAGPIGHLAGQLLRKLGADVLVVDPDERRLALFSGMAFSTTAEVSRRSLAGVQTVIEATGADGVVDAIADSIDPGAQLIVLGRPQEDGQLLALGGANGARVEAVGSLASDSRDWPEAIRLLGSGDPDLGWLTGNVAPLDEYEAAWDGLREHRVLKTILAVDGLLAKE